MKKNDIMKKWLGKKIRQHRLDLDITQLRLAELLNVRAPSICEWEKGRSYPTLPKLFLLSKILKMSIVIDQTELTKIEKELKESSNATTKI